MAVYKSIRIDEEVLKKLEKIAEEERRNLSNLISKILAEYVENN